MTLTATEGARRFDVAHRTLRPKTHPGWRLVFSDPEEEDRAIAFCGPYKAKVLQQAAGVAQAALRPERPTVSIVGRLTETSEPADRFEAPPRRDDPSCIEIVASLGRPPLVILNGTMRPLPV